MNFDFLKGLCGLGEIYENCTNAEKLAIKMPKQSLFTSRNSAEALAKFIYMTAYKQEVERISFIDILNDDVVCDFINNRRVMNAFHSIRKIGNQAVHGYSQETPDMAINALENLHFVAGETACMLGLISNYPRFDSNVEEVSGFGVNAENDINKKALQMFMEYAMQYDAEQEREKYYTPSDEEFFEYLIQGVADFHERLVFDHQPKHIALIEYIQNYILLLNRLSVERSPEMADEIELADPVTIDIKVQIDGEKTYLLNDSITTQQIFAEKIPHARSFTIDCRCKGNLREIFYGDENDVVGKLHKDRMWDGSGMLDKLESFKRKEKFTYYKIQFYPNSGNVTGDAIINGKSKDIQDLFSEDILLNPELKLDCDGFRIYVDGEKSLAEYPALLEELKSIVRNNVFEGQLHFCEEAWDPEDLDYEEDCVMPFVQIKGFSVNAYQSFLDKLNRCLEPWKDELEFWILDPNLEEPMVNDSANILYDLDNLVLAVVEIKDGKLRLAGTTFGNL